MTRVTARAEHEAVARGNERVTAARAGLRRKDLVELFHGALIGPESSRLPLGS
jgi:hypothetical protein